MKRVMRFIGNREEPEKELFGFEEVLHRDPYPVIDFSKSVPNPLFSDFEEKSAPGYLVRSDKPEDGTYASIVRDLTWSFERDEIQPKQPPKEEPFETNLTEPLIGWRTWNLANGKLASLYHQERPWEPDVPFHATCREEKCTESPTTFHTCGIYATDAYAGIRDYEGESEVIGMVLGWGRYVRGGDGWRAEYAYPAKFLIGREQIGLVDDLKKYHVPIYIWEPMRMYDPKEDGYEYWNHEENWNFGAGSESDASEDSYEDEED